MWTQSAQAVPLAPGRDRVVEVARRRRVDREGGQLGQVAAAALARLGGIGGPPRFDLQRRGEAAPSEPLVAAARSTASRAFFGSPAPPPAARPLPLPVVAPVALAHCPRPATRESARSSASSRGVRRSSRRLHVGVDAVALGEVDAVGGEVLADRQLQRAAVGEADLLLEDALAVGAGADHLGAGVVGQRRGEDLRRRGGVAVDQDDDRQLRQVVADGLVDGVALGARVGRHDDFVLGQEDAGAQHRLLEQAAAVAAQVEHDPFGPFLLHLFDRFAQQRVDAFAEGDQAHVADLAPARPP